MTEKIKSHLFNLALACGLVLIGFMGVALAATGDAAAGDPVSDFDPLWWALAALGLVSAAVSLGIDTRTRPSA